MLRRDPEEASSVLLVANAEGIEEYEREMVVELRDCFESVMKSIHEPTTLYTCITHTLKRHDIRE